MAKHDHFFHLWPIRFGPYGSQDVHYHACVPDGDETCDVVLLAWGRECDGKGAGHHRVDLADKEEVYALIARLRPIPLDPPPTYETLWRCSTCGRWSHAKRCPASHVRYLPEHHPELKGVDEAAIEWVENGREPDTGAPVYSAKFHCGPFEEWYAERA